MMNGPRRVYVIVGLVVLAAVLIVLFGGCAMMKGRIKSGGVTVQSPKDGNSASLSTDKTAAVLPLPAGSKVTVTKFAAVAGSLAGDGRPAFAAQPAREVTEVTLSRDTEWRKEEDKVVADTGTIDNTVAVKRIQAAENRYLLFAAIGAAVAGGFFLYIKYPTPAMMCGAASVVFFLAWRLSSMPDWFWVLGASAVVAAVFLWRGYERGTKEAPVIVSPQN